MSSWSWAIVVSSSVNACCRREGNPGSMAPATAREASSANSRRERGFDGPRMTFRCRIGRAYTCPRVPARLYLKRNRGPGVIPASIVFYLLLNFDGAVHLRMDVARVGVRTGDRKRPLDRHVRIGAADVRRGAGLGREEHVVGHGSEREPDNVAGAHLQRRGRKREPVCCRDSVSRRRRRRRAGHRSVTAAAAEEYSDQRNDGEVRLEPKHVSLPGVWYHQLQSDSGP